MKDWEEAITRVLAREGGWSDRVIDKGGPTNRGVSWRQWVHWRTGRALGDTPPHTPAQLEDLKLQLKLLSEVEARAFYLQRFVKDTNLELIPSEAVQEALFDWMINSGPGVAVKALQRELGLPVDGLIGPVTAAATVTKDGTRLAMWLIFARIRFIANWMRKDKTDADKDGVPDSMENAAGILIRIAEQGRALA